MSLIISFLLLVVAVSNTALAQEVKPPVSPSVWLYETEIIHGETSKRFKYPLGGPVYTATDPSNPDAGPVGLGGIDLCAILEKWQASKKTHPLFVITEDKGQPTFSYEYTVDSGRTVKFFAKNRENREKCKELLDTKKLILAYGGYCVAGIEFLDPKDKDTPHFSDPFSMAYRFDQVQTPNGPVWQLSANHYTKAFVVSNEEMRNSALLYIIGLIKGTDDPDVRGGGMPVILKEQLPALPLRKEYKWLPE